MSNNIIVSAEKRSEQGKGASRRLRRNGQVPAILYGGDAEPVAIALNHNVLEKQLHNPAFASSILHVELDGEKIPAIIKDLQRHPAKPKIVHADFQRVSAKEPIRVSVPLDFEGEEEAPGIKLQSGVATHALNEVEVSCLPGDLPESIRVDMSGLKVGDSVHLSDLKLPKGVEIIALTQGADHDAQVAAIEATRATATGGDEEAEEAEAAGEEAGEGEADQEGEEE
ncbi:50S ribosomal protein L25/general stress protein Ctc [Thiohalospira sp.]|uniref:50S ribosomal protein L25/general stress protein Ctc n=1 Tax=Thiohalospira sp. TaxID=3080549 RepID=UPI00397F4D7D